MLGLIATIAAYERYAKKAEREKQRQAEAARLDRIERDQIRQAKEQERLAKEQARQAAQLAKHEDLIARMEQQILLAEREVARYQPIVDQLRQERDALASKVQHYADRGLPCAGYKDQLAKIDAKLYSAETKLVKANFTKQNAQRKLAAA